ncbi:MAG: hypothetical protein RIC55_10005 [Pirellulaceae bacterium]
MPSLTRRQFTQQSLGGLLAFSLIETALQCDVLAASVKPEIVAWLKEIHQLGVDLKASKMKQVAWQKQIETLYGRVELKELLALIDFEELTKRLKLLDQGALSLRFSFDTTEGPSQYSFGKQIFALKEGCSVVPHGHNNMATAFLVLKGNFHGRHYDRLADEEEHFLIRPTIDEKFGPGGCSTVSDFKDNIHWFKALDGPSFIFNIHVFHKEGDSDKLTGRVYVDPDGESVEGGMIRAPRIDYKTAVQKYG